MRSPAADAVGETAGTLIFEETGHNRIFTKLCFCVYNETVNEKMEYR